MALTFTKTHAGVHGDQKYWQGTVTFDSSYASGGESYTAADFNMSTVEHLVAVADGSGNLNIMPQWVKASSKIRLVVPSTGAQATGDQSGVVCTVTVYGQ